MSTIKKYITKDVKGILHNVPAYRFIRIVFISFLISHISHLAIAQEERSLTREGNKFFDKQKYADAEASYKKALEKKNNFPEAMFNLGDAMYKQERYDDAIKQFELAAKSFTDSKIKAQCYHNLGNCQLDKKEYQTAVDAYKQSLKLNPNDRDTKYNLSYANSKLNEKNKQDQQNKDNKKNDKDQQKKDQKDQNKKDKGDKDKQDKKDQDKKDKGDKGDKDQKQPKGQQSKLTKEQAEKLLEALSPEEKKALEKMIKAQAKPVDARIEKDW